MRSSWVWCLAALERILHTEAAALPRSDDTQIVLGQGADIDDGIGKVSKGSVQLKLETNYTHDLVYFTHVEIGSPPRPFRVLIDLGTPDTFVSSVECDDCFPGDNRYDSDESSTSRSENRTVAIDNQWFVASGPLYQDIFQIGGLSIRDQTFLAASHATSVGLAWDDMSQVHGFLGLAPTIQGSDFEGPSLLMSLAEQKVLDANLITIRLREPQVLTIGAINSSLYHGDIEYVPLTHEPVQQGRPGLWQTSANYIALGGQPGLRIDLDGYTAVFATSYAFMFLPTDIAFSIVKTLEFQNIPFMPPAVPCDRLHTMPDLTFNLAGKNFTLTPYDYTLEWPTGGSPRLCASAIFPSGVLSADTKEIRLGNAFLRKFYSIWDMDGRIGFADLSVF